ncbi:MAG: Methyl-coenzyme M reductase I subunit alpha [Candidatus Bathyarchaeota archaeon BA2]|uniref:coenzyme-B sulfoethylthiotransferase n=1 Tax=uncultured Bathyarchaeota archaeon TaxID=1739975 RepID=A0A0P0KNW3_9ARCH|nr:methyl-coenzyme M reductase subunit alpha [uncultured Bathyarchaeota archaeon]KPV61791.1 MAG: Methyl-coenzyme M reductase I subunit alpha [Candidatus Bathyarchaeota archaeon BA2]
MEEKEERKKFYDDKGQITARERDYVRELYAVSKKFLPTERRRAIYSRLEKQFGADPLSLVDSEMYKRGGYRQSKRKQEFVKSGRQIAIERGIPAYNRAVGIPLGQRILEPYVITGTDITVEQDDTHHVNNPAIQQMVDDIKRTTIVNIDIAHRMLQVRAGKEVTPETINLYLETLNHTMCGGAVAQEHMSEINPLLVKDAYAKVITGSDEIKDALDRRYVIDIDRLFHPTRAEQLKKALGNSIWVVLRTPTIAIRMADGDEAHRWAAMQNTMAFIGSYGLSGEHVVSDLAYSFKHARVVNMGNKMWYQRMRGRNEPGGFPDGYICDFIQSERDLPARPFLEVSEEDPEEAKKYSRAMYEGIGAIAAVLDNMIWLGFYMSGGIGFSNTVSAAGLAGGVIEDITEELIETTHRYIRGIKKVPPKWDIVRFIVDMIIQYVMESYEKFPALSEFHWGGAHKVSIIGSMGAGVASLLTGSSTMGMWAGHYAIALVMKEGWLRTGWAGQEIQDHIGLPSLCSFRPEEGNFAELRGLNYPMQSFSAAHGSLRDAAIYGAMIGRGSAWSASPVVKVAFADPHLVFDFKNPRLCIAKACIKQFMPAGERGPSLPAH